jgi:hypothetical protein
MISRRSTRLLGALLLVAFGGTLAGHAGADTRRFAEVTGRAPLPSITCDDVRAMMHADRPSESESVRVALLCVREAAEWNRWLEWLRAQSGDTRAHQ